MIVNLILPKWLQSWGWAGQNTYNRGITHQVGFARTRDGYYWRFWEGGLRMQDPHICHFLRTQLIKFTGPSPLTQPEPSETKSTSSLIAPTFMLYFVYTYWYFLTKNLHPYLNGKYLPDDLTRRQHLSNGFPVYDFSAFTYFFSCSSKTLEMSIIPSYN